MRFELTNVRPRKRPTWLGWLLIATLLCGLFLGFIASLYPFLAPEKPPHKGLMVVEGWIHDFALDEAIILFKTGNYSKIVCTGVPIETGSYIQQFKSYPEMTAARLKKMGIPPEKIIVSVADEAKKDRTYMAAVALREAFMAYNIDETELHLITTGPHGRRSRMLFQKALGDKYNIGITCLAPASYTPEDWYKGSEGVRYVMSEWLAYVYAKLFFYP
ncbi:YdcF family protein [Pontiellaceae bacterium B12219]|nr:YdcF family protein [Pontiellaceae bacterium B12219]